MRVDEVTKLHARVDQVDELRRLFGRPRRGVALVGVVLGLVDASKRAEELRRSGKTVSFAAVDGSYAGLRALGDTVKPTSKQAIAELRETGLRVIMLTGDARTSAIAIGRELGLDECWRRRP